jgi:hypothetical protein
VGRVTEFVAGIQQQAYVVQQTGHLEFEIFAMPLCQQVCADRAVRDQHRWHVPGDRLLDGCPPVEKPPDPIHRIRYHKTQRNYSVSALSSFNANSKPN